EPRLSGALDQPREGNPRGDPGLVEDVSEVTLDGLLAEKQLRGNLWIGLAIDDESRHLQFPLCQRFDAGSVGSPSARPTVGMPSELPQFTLRLVAVSKGAEGVER